MAVGSFRKALFRERDSVDAGKVMPIELFFDLVFVFAITQLSHRLLEHLTAIGLVETVVLFAAIWWLWIYTSWATNWLDPAHGAVRFMLVAMMLGSLVMSTSIPGAFEDQGLIFAGCYVAMQLLRTFAIAVASAGVSEGRKRNFLRIAFYFLLSAPLWVAGALSGHDARLAFWVAALAIEYAGPALFFTTPGLGRSRDDDWDISGAHMAERCALFIIIALGETILVTGATFAKLEGDPATTAAFVTALTGSVTMWWIYFDVGAKRAGVLMEETEETGRLARSAFTYLHMPIVTGILIAAVGDELVMAHPHGHSELSFILVTCGGPLLFLAGNQVFKAMTSELPMPPLSHFIGQALLIATGGLGWLFHWQPLTIAMGAAGALLVTALWEWFSLHGGWQRWIPWMRRSTAVAIEDSER